MLYTELKVPIKGIHQALVAGQRLKGNGIDEVHGVFRHENVNGRPCFYQGAGKAGNLIAAMLPVTPRSIVFPFNISFLRLFFRFFYDTIIAQIFIDENTCGRKESFT